MTDTEYRDWVKIHVTSTAANADAVSALMSPLVRRYFDEVGATAAELEECTYRLLAGARGPKFASEHHEAVAVELRRLREDRAAAARPDPGAWLPDGPACRWCEDTGMVTVPHPVCVLAPRDGPPRLVAYRDRNGIRYDDVVEVSVVCDRPGCAAGQRESASNGRQDRPRPTFGRYLAIWGGRVEPVSLLLQLRADQGARCREGKSGRDGFTALVESIKARVRAAEAAREQGGY